FRSSHSPLAQKQHRLPICQGVSATLIRPICAFYNLDRNAQQVNWTVLEQDRHASANCSRERYDVHTTGDGRKALEGGVSSLNPLRWVIRASGRGDCLCQMCVD